MIRRKSRIIFFLTLIASIIYLYLYNSGLREADPRNLATTLVGDGYRADNFLLASNDEERKSHQLVLGSNVIGNDILTNETCPRIVEYVAQIDVRKTYPNLEFEGDWISTRMYWNPEHEKRYQSVKSNYSGLGSAKEPKSLKVFVVPHSHNDPGWLRTYESYFHTVTRQILDNAVQKLDELKQMKFIWSEISFLSKWWEQADPSKRNTFKRLVAEGRLEIVTGGLVMTDEATVNLYSMIDQLVEGHQWLKAHLGIVPKSSWSVDPFGHGSTLPYLLQSSGISSMVIQRIHFGWKKYFLDHQSGDFRWMQRWDSSQSHPIHCHNSPFDSYSVKTSCGPNPEICPTFDFSSGAIITSKNLTATAELMLGQYGRTASALPHNVAMIMLGDDFRFSSLNEWDQQYTNYMKLFEYINANKEKYNAEVQFGTVSDYFKELERRSYEYPTLSGDFHVYSDMFTEGHPDYWSGYYTTRPFWKKFFRETENIVRGAEILFTYVNSLGKQRSPTSDGVSAQDLNVQYSKLIIARRWLGLFAHHDATTGTSKQETMNDYGLKLLEAMKHATTTQITAISAILFGNANNSKGLHTSFELETFGVLPKQIPISVLGKRQKLVLYNNLGRTRVHLAKIVITSPHVEVIGPSNEPVMSQLSPVIELSDSNLVISSKVYEVSFLAELPPLSVSVYEIRSIKPLEGKSGTRRSLVSCTKCIGSENDFDSDEIPSGDIQLTNDKLELLFEGTGFLKKVTRMREETSAQVKLTFGGYGSRDRHSGAYLLMPHPKEQEIPFKYSKPELFLVRGPLYSELLVRHSFLLLSTRIFHTGGKLFEEAIFMQNQVDLRKHYGEVFMRIDTDIESTTKLENPDYKATWQPSFITDQAGFTFERRTKIPKIKYQGNTYPVNTMSYIQDTKGLRLSLLVDRSHGCSTMEVGRLECMIDRRIKFDEARGIREGITDNRPTISNYVLFLEKLELKDDYQSTLPTLPAHHLSQELSYPSFLYLYEEDESSERSTEPKVISLMNHELPCDSHLVNLRTLTDYDQNLPSQKVLLIGQKLGYLCQEGKEKESCAARRNWLFWKSTVLNGLQISKIVETGLTGVIELNRRNLTYLYDIMASPFEIVSVVLTL